MTSGVSTHLASGSTVAVAAWVAAAISAFTARKEGSRSLGQLLQSQQRLLVKEWQVMGKCFLSTEMKKMHEQQVPKLVCTEITCNIVVQVGYTSRPQIPDQDF